jgi:hypothetical protein
MPSQGERHLAETDRHIAETEARVAHQRELIATQAAAGEDATVSLELLKVLERSLALSRQHRRLVLEEIAVGSL